MPSDISGFKESYCGKIIGFISVTSRARGNKSVDGSLLVASLYLQDALPVLAYTLPASDQRANRHLENLASLRHLLSLHTICVHRSLNLLLVHALPQHHQLQDHRHRQRMPGR